MNIGRPFNLNVRRLVSAEQRQGIPKALAQRHPILCCHNAACRAVVHAVAIAIVAVPETGAAITAVISQRKVAVRGIGLVVEALLEVIVQAIVGQRRTIQRNLPGSMAIKVIVEAVAGCCAG